MCGISGIRRPSGSPVEAAELRPMIRALVHRGPDDEGTWVGEGIGLGHRRLSIIDVAGSRQPMHLGRHHLCYNGEIFNYRALRDELAASGHTFETQGDTEVLLALHASLGPKAAERLEGQFAYAAWNDETRDLWLVRDRLGVLPLYYYYDGKTFLFASEIKALLAGLGPDHPPEVDRDSLKEYLAYRSVPSPHTLFRHVRKLPPGHWLRLDARGELRIEPYWSLPTAPARGEFAKEEALDAVETALASAVEHRLVADVPVGAYLSGGVDSSLIVALMSKLTDGAGIETFSAGFGDPRYDELPHARRVSARFETHHHEVTVAPADFETLWPKLTWHRDAPISEPADVAIHRLATVARDHVKVLLSGEGSDELFAGYPKYAVATKVEGLARLPAGARAALLRRVERWLPAGAFRPRTLLRALAEPGEADRLQAWFAPFVSWERDALLPGPERGGHREIWERSRGDLIQRMLYADCHTWLVDNLLERGDRMAMAASVESRPPFMDHRLVELAFRIPSSLKVRGGVTKWLVKEIASRHLPADIVHRKKVGFRVPLDAWFRGGLRGMANDLLLGRDSFVGGNLDRTHVERLLRDHASGRRNEELRIWTLLGLEIWHRTFFRSGDVGTPPERV